MSSDYQLEDTVFLPFTTRAFATGIPTVLAGTPAIDIYEDATATPIITGETLVVSLNSVAGFNMITVTATAGTGFGAGQSYTAIIQAGTVGGVSVVGEVVAHFTLDMSAAAKDLANGTDGLGAIKSDTAAILLDTAEIGTAGAGLTNINLPNQTMDIVGNITGNLSGSVGSVTGAVGSVAGNVDGSVASVTAGVTLAAGAVTNASLAGNMEIVFETDFATNYNTTRNAWVTNFTDIIGSYTAQTGDSFALIGTGGAGLGDLGGMSTAMKAEVNAEVLDVLTVDTFAEPGSVPAATASLKDKIGWLMSLARNKLTQTATTQTLRNDADSSDIATATVSDDGTTFTRNEFS